MASIIKDINIDVAPADAWAALRDFDALHQRLVPGFVVDARPDGDGTRIVTFFNGAVAREQLVGIDDEQLRLAYTVVESAFDCAHHNAAAQVVAADDGGSRFIWITDVLPDEIAPRIGEMMEAGLGVIKRTLEAQVVPA